MADLINPRIIDLRFGEYPVKKAYLNGKVIFERLYMFSEEDINNYSIINVTSLPVESRIDENLLKEKINLYSNIKLITLADQETMGTLKLLTKTDDLGYSLEAVLLESQNKSSAYCADSVVDLLNVIGDNFYYQTKVESNGEGELNLYIVKTMYEKQKISTKNTGTVDCIFIKNMQSKEFHKIYESNTMNFTKQLSLTSENQIKNFTFCQYYTFKNLSEKKGFSYSYTNDNAVGNILVALRNINGETIVNSNSNAQIFQGQIVALNNINLEINTFYKVFSSLSNTIFFTSAEKSNNFTYATNFVNNITNQLGESYIISKEEVFLTQLQADDLTSFTNTQTLYWGKLMGLLVVIKTATLKNKTYTGRGNIELWYPPIGYPSMDNEIPLPYTNSVVLNKKDKIDIKKNRRKIEIRQANVVWHDTKNSVLGVI